jgi:hypothetical protein
MVMCGRTEKVGGAVSSAGAAGTIPMQTNTPEIEQTTSAFMRMEHPFRRLADILTGLQALGVRVKGEHVD